MAMAVTQNAAAQSSILGGYGSGLGQSIGNSTGTYETPRRVESYFDINRMTTMKVVDADNGFVILTQPDGGGRGRMLVASSIEEVRDLITAELVTKKMEK
jgi:hypothetical protein